jgi:DNA-binding beta-propeller fold protein YncE
MLQTFDCPKCGAPVSYEKDVVGANLTARCSYCNSALSVPDELHGRPAQIISTVHIDLRNAVPSGGRVVKWLLLIALVPLLAGVVAVIAMGGLLAPLFRSQPVSSVAKSTPTGGTSRRADKVTPAAFATTLLNFGSEGIGPGMFKDARAIAVDAAGKIYVGEYSGGRIQVFDPDGKFLTQWSVDPKMPLRGLAADRGGTVYVVQSGTISRFEGASGKPLGQVAYTGGWGFDDIRVAADGGLVAAWNKNRDDIVRFNSSGEVVRTIRAAISTVTDSSELDTHVAIDGLGNIYALGTFNNAVFKFTPDGKYQTRFGSDGDQPGQFRAPSAVAVDGKGRVYVSDFKGVQVFDGNGRYLTVFNPGGIASGMVFNDQNQLLIAARNHVLKLALTDPSN